MMENKRDKESRLEDGLRHLPDRIPPVDLQDRIMAALPANREPWFRRLGQGFVNILPQPFLPLRAAVTMASLALAFYWGTQFDGFNRNPSVSHGGSPPVSESMNGDAYFYLGRSLLASGQPEEALEAFHRAELLRPGNPEYTLWQGAAYYVLGDVDEERQQYQQLILRRPDYLPARLNLAHNLLQGGEPDQAEQLYEQVLERDPTEKTSLYNRALALHLQKKTSAEARAWKEYLHQYRTGRSAYRALQHLQKLGEYGYRSYQLGFRTVILNQELLLGHPGADQDREINYLADQLSRQSADELNVVVFIEGDAQRAKQVARALRTAIIERVPDWDRKSIRISWFGEPESIETVNRESISLSEGILIFRQPENNQKMEERV